MCSSRVSTNRCAVPSSSCPPEIFVSEPSSPMEKLFERTFGFLAVIRENVMLISGQFCFIIRSTLGGCRLFFSARLFVQSGFLFSGFDQELPARSTHRPGTWPRSGNPRSRWPARFAKEGFSPCAPKTLGISVAAVLFRFQKVL